MGSKDNWVFRKNIIKVLNWAQQSSYKRYMISYKGVTISAMIIALGPYQGAETFLFQKYLTHGITIPLYKIYNWIRYTPIFALVIHTHDSIVSITRNHDFVVIFCSTPITKLNHDYVVNNIFNTMESWFHCA